MIGHQCKRCEERLEPRQDHYAGDCGEDYIMGLERSLLFLTENPGLTAPLTVLGRINGELHRALQAKLEPPPVGVSEAGGRRDASD